MNGSIVDEENAHGVFYLVSMPLFLVLESYAFHGRFQKIHRRPLRWLALSICGLGMTALAAYIALTATSILFGV